MLIDGLRMIVPLSLSNFCWLQHLTATFPSVLINIQENAGICSGQATLLIVGLF